MTVKEMRDFLVSSGEYTREEVEEIKGVQNLKDAINEIQNSESTFEDFEEQPNLEVRDLLYRKEEMNLDNEGWTEYVLSLLRANELKDGNPTCNGLRRLTQKLIGPIISSKVVQLFAPSNVDGVGRATVVYEVVVQDVRDYVDLNNIPIIVVSDVADCWPGNSANAYAVHPSATASTRAEGRCYRKLLNLNIITAEEGDNPNDPNQVVSESIGKQYEDTASEIQNSQKIVIKSKCDALNINLMKMMKNEFNDKYIDINQLSRVDAALLVTLVNQYQAKGNIPDEIKN